MRIRTRLLAALLATASLVIAAQAHAQAPVSGRAIVFSRGFDVMYWDSVNGLRTIDAGLEPAISSDGRFVAYIGRGESQCNPVEVYDVRNRTQVPVPGANFGECNSHPALSGDGRYLVYQGVPGTAGGPSDLYLYDVVAQQPIALGAPVNTFSSEESPSLSDDGSLLAFVSGRNGPAFDDVFLANISNPAAPSLIALPGLNSNEADRDAYMSGDAQTIAYVSGPELGRHTNVYDRTTASVLSTPALSQGEDIYDPALNRSGSIVAVARQSVDLGDTAIALYDRATGGISEPDFLQSDLTEEGPGIADPVQLFDDTRPTVELKCKSRKDDVITCKVTVSEPARVKLKGKRSGVKAKKSARFAEAGTKRMKLRFKREVEGRAKVTAKAIDDVGLAGKAKKRVKVK